jgi:hypothetical protein
VLLLVGLALTLALCSATAASVAGGTQHVSCEAQAVECLQLLSWIAEPARFCCLSLPFSAAAAAALLVVADSAVLQRLRVVQTILRFLCLWIRPVCLEDHRKDPPWRHEHRCTSR